MTVTKVGGDRLVHIFWGDASHGCHRLLCLWLPLCHRWYVVKLVCNEAAV